MLHFCPVYSDDDDEEEEAGFYHKRRVTGAPGLGREPCGPPREHGPGTSDTECCLQLEPFISCILLPRCVLDLGISGWDLAGYIAGGSD